MLAWKNFIPRFSINLVNFYYWRSKSIKIVTHRGKKGKFLQLRLNMIDLISYTKNETVFPPHLMTQKQLLFLDKEKLSVFLVNWPFDLTLNKPFGLILFEFILKIGKFFEIWPKWKRFWFFTINSCYFFCHNIKEIQLCVLDECNAFMKSNKQISAQFDIVKSAKCRQEWTNFPF